MESAQNLNQNKALILEPLCLNEVKANEIVVRNPLKCLFCEIQFSFPLEKDFYLKHLFMDHRFVIADCNDIADLEEYLLFWRQEFNPVDLSDTTSLIPEYCTTMLLKQLPDGTVTTTDEKYYLLSDILPKDRKIREDLKEKVIEKALKCYQLERTDENCKRECLYCRSYPGPTRIKYVEHLYEKHFLNLGKPENLVFIDELIDVIQSKLTSLICIWCERVFKDRPTLKEHMRKKGHKRINPENKFYDKYYIVNYKLDKQGNTSSNDSANQGSIRTSEPSIFQTQNENDSDWSDWDDNIEQDIICLFCSFKDTKFDQLKLHMMDQHDFNYDSMFQKLSFYQKVKLVNFIRRKIHLKECFQCDKIFEVLGNLMEHMLQETHFDLSLMDEKLWDKPEYFFPTFEDDSLLCYLEEDLSENDMMEDPTNDRDAVVISEDKTFTVNEEAEQLSRENFKL